MSEDRYARGWEKLKQVDGEAVSQTAYGTARHRANCEVHKEY